MAKPRFITVPNASPATGQPFDLKAPFMVYSVSNFGTDSRDPVPSFDFATSLVHSYAEHDDEGFVTAIIQIYDQHGRLAVDMRRANPTSFNVTYHPDFTRRFG